MKIQSIMFVTIAEVPIINDNADCPASIISTLNRMLLKTDIIIGAPMNDQTIPNEIVIDMPRIRLFLTSSRKLDVLLSPVILSMRIPL